MSCTPKVKVPEEVLRIERLTDALVKDILYLTDEEVLQEMEEDGGNLVNKIEVIVKKALQEARDIGAKEAEK